MKEHYKELVRNSVTIIKEQVEQGKSVDYIKDCIFHMITEANNASLDLNHFDRYYFKRWKGLRISAYIKEVQRNYATEKYEKCTNKRIRQTDTFCGVSCFKKKYLLNKEGKEMKKYFVTNMYDMKKDDLRWLTDEEENENMIFLEARCKNEAIREYLSVQCEFQPEEILKKMLFKDLWTSIGYGECEYIEEFSNSREILMLVERIYRQYFENANLEPEELYDRYNTDEISNEYWKYLTKEDIKKAYYICNRYDVFCLELKSLASHKRTQRKNEKNIIKDISQEDMHILNTLAALVRKEKKESYQITQKVFEEFGYNIEEAETLIKHLESGEFKSNIHMTYEDSIYNRRLFKPDYNRYCNEIYPDELFYKLAEENFDFNNGKNDMVIKIIKEHKE